MTNNHDQIRELLAELVDLDQETQEQRLQEIQQQSLELYDAVQSLLPFTEGDLDETDHDPFVGEVVGHYIIVKRIGSGGMGRVYLAKQEKPERNVAIKIVRQGLLSRSASKRFEIECRLLGQLHHGGIAQIYEAGTHLLGGDRIPWIAMEFIEDAMSITMYASKQSLTIKEKLLCFKEVCKAIAEAHRHGIIHRDLKPANILVNAQGTPKIIDFGVAKAIDPIGLPTEFHTSTQDFVGTMQYMSPEQARGERIDTTSDLYSLGVLLYELLAGKQPYDLQSTTIAKAIETLRESDPIPLRTYDKKIHRDVETVVSHAMAYDPAQRYRSANELCDDIQRLLDGEPVAASKESFLSKFLRRKRRTAAAIVLALPFLFIATCVSLYYSIQTTKALNDKTK
ncbi:MAG: serine/threonine-protein kinase, partial [Phycisphaerales bacterium]|nr:serine/threonine-protein kinase [Phycisphaerales bacterium]